MIYWYHFPAGGSPGNSWLGCAVCFLKSRPYFRPKNVIFHTTPILQVWDSIAFSGSLCIWMMVTHPFQRVVFFKLPFYSRLPSIVCKPFFFFVFSTQKGGWAPRLFLAATVETGNKNRDDFHCMQMRLVMSMWFIFGDDWGDARRWSCSSMAF